MVTKTAGSLSIFFSPSKGDSADNRGTKAHVLITHLAGDGDMKAYRKCQAFLSGERDVVVVAAQDNCTAEAKSEGNKSERGRLFQSHVIRIIYLTACRLLVAKLAFLVSRVCLAQSGKISAVTPWFDKRRHCLCFSVFFRTFYHCVKTDLNEKQSAKLVCDEIFDNRQQKKVH